jgi:hypothetical protein
MDKIIKSKSNEVAIEEEKKTQENKIKNEALTTELQFELLKQYAWFSSAIIGAVVILIQLKLVPLDSGIYFPLGCFCFSILNSLIAQDYIVESLSNGVSIYDISKKIYYLRLLSIFGLGIGSGLLMKAFM